MRNSRKNSVRMRYRSRTSTLPSAGRFRHQPPPIATAPSIRKTAGYAQPTQQSANTAMLSTADPVTNRIPGSRTEPPTSIAPNPIAAATVNAAPNRIARACILLDEPRAQQHEPELLRRRRLIGIDGHQVHSRLVEQIVRHLVLILIIAGMVAAHAIQRPAVDCDRKGCGASLVESGLRQREVHVELQPSGLGEGEAQYRMIVSPAPAALAMRPKSLHDESVGSGIAHHDERGGGERRLLRGRRKKNGQAMAACPQQTGERDEHCRRSGHRLILALL